MAKRDDETAASFLPAKRDLTHLTRAAKGCTACPLHRNATQTVFGEGPAHAEVILVGEQPGDLEDRTGHPFVGPAGKLLDRALEAAGVDRGDCYVTNTVKHFKWREGTGKKRLHEKPNAGEVHACMPWLLAEIAAVRPRIVVCLGATAAQALMGRDFRVTTSRGELFPIDDRTAVVATVHPSSILRAPDDRTRAAELAAFIRDLRQVARWLALPRRASSDELEAP